MPAPLGPVIKPWYAKPGAEPPRHLPGVVDAIGEAISTQRPEISHSLAIGVYDV